MKAFARIGVFIQRGAVEVRQAIGVAGKMPRHPVEDHVNAGPMRRSHKRLKVGRSAETPGRRVQT
ncbi:hypothetical protein D3C78_1431220 [compost metagenome]